MALKPENLSHGEATAAAFGGLLALQYVDKGTFSPERTCSSAAHQVLPARWRCNTPNRLGPRVTGVCSTNNLDFVKSLGADDVIDYTRIDALPAGARYAFVLDSVGGAKSSKLKAACKKARAPGGRYVSIDDGNLELSSRRLERLTTLIESRAMSPVVGRTYPLDEVAEAHRFVQSGHKRGGVVVTIP